MTVSQNQNSALNGNAPIRAQRLPPALAALGEFPQFILWRSEPRRVATDGRTYNAAELRAANYSDAQIAALPVAEGKPDKVPQSPAGAHAASALDPASWLPYATAAERAAMLGPAYGVGFVLTAADPFACIDVDGCREGGGWSDTARLIGEQLPGAAVEVSTNGSGLHFWFRYSGPSFEGRKNTALNVELYTQARFIALGQIDGAAGNAGTDHTAALERIRADYFPNTGNGSNGTARAAEWTTAPLGGKPIADDAGLIAAASRAVSAASVLSDGVSFADLWRADPDALARAFPADAARADGAAFDASAADFSLACRLAWWTGGDCERIERLMRRSGLMREKWDARPDYLRNRTIAGAVTLQAAKNGGTGDWYTGGKANVAPAASTAVLADPNGAAVAVNQIPHDTAAAVLKPAKPGELAAALMIEEGHTGGHVYAVDSDAWYSREDGKLWRLDKKALRLGSLIRTYMAVNELQRGSSVSGILTHLRIGMRDYGAWDTEPYLLGLPEDRVLDVETGQARDAVESDRISRRLSVSPEAGTPGTWLRVLKETHAGKPDAAEVIRYLQVFVGYCLTGLTTAQRFLFIVGAPASGKGTFVSTLARIWGTGQDEGYATSIPSDALLDGRSQHAQWLTLFDGPRLAIVGESNNDSSDYRGRAWRLGDLKMITGGEPISANKMRRDSYTFEPSAKLIVASNNIPDMRRFDEALKRRLVLVRCDNPRPEADRDEWLQHKLKAEDGRILAWALEGARQYLAARKLPPLPASMRAARDEYLQEQDTYGEFLKAAFMDAPGEFVTSEQVRIAHTLWLAENGEAVRWNDRMRKPEMTRRGYAYGPHRVNGKQYRGFFGLRKI